MSYIQPLLTIVLAILVAGVWRCWTSEGKRMRLLVGGVLALFLLSWPPAAWLLSLPFDGWYSPRALPIGEAQAIVVLASGVLPPVPQRPFPLPDLGTYERCQYAAWLYKNWRPLPVVACGGSSHNQEPSAAAMRRILQAAGVPESMIWIEGRSHSTYENALYGAELLRAKGVRHVALVTEAYHMLRAEKCFRKQGLSVTPAPCGFHTLEVRFDGLIPGWRAIYQDERTLHEAVGLAWYWIRGWI